jgi:hypothetical protein
MRARVDASPRERNLLGGLEMQQACLTRCDRLVRAVKKRARRVSAEWVVRVGALRIIARRHL